MHDLANAINRQELDHTFRIENGTVVDAPGEYAPEVYHSETDDVEIAAPGWECLTGYTLQDSYRGAVMHPTEGIGTRIAEHMAEIAQDAPGTVFALVTVETLDDDDAPAGWAIAYKSPAE